LRIIGHFAADRHRYARLTHSHHIVVCAEQPAAHALRCAVWNLTSAGPVRLIGSSRNDARDQMPPGQPLQRFADTTWGVQGMPIAIDGDHAQVQTPRARFASGTSSEENPAPSAPPDRVRRTSTRQPLGIDSMHCSSFVLDQTLTALRISARHDNARRAAGNGSHPVQRPARQRTPGWTAAARTSQTPDWWNRVSRSVARTARNIVRGVVWTYAIPHRPSRAPIPPFSSGAIASWAVEGKLDPGVAERRAPPVTHPNNRGSVAWGTFTFGDAEVA